MGSEVGGLTEGLVALDTSKSHNILLLSMCRGSGLRSKRPMSLYVCATCSELASNLSTMRYTASDFRDLQVLIDPTLAYL